MSYELIQAVREENTELAKKLILSGADVNFRWQNNVTPLIEVSKKGNREIIELLIKYNADVHATDSHGVNALMHAVYYGQKDAVLLLLNTEIDVNARDNYGNSALINCVRVKYELINEDDFKENNIERNELPLRNIPSTKYPFQKPFSYELITYSNINLEILKALIEKNADINITDSYKKTPLMYTVKQENIEAVEIILSYNPDINLVSASANTALCYATQINSTEIALNLINAGADINFKDKYENSPLTYANMFGNELLVKTLLSKGADLDIGYFHPCTKGNIQRMINTAKYVDSFLGNNSKKFEAPVQIDSEILTARYEFFLNKPDIDTLTLYKQLSKLSSSNLMMENRIKLNKIYEDIVSKRAENPEDNIKMLNYSSSSGDLTSSEGSSSDYGYSFSRQDNSSDSEMLGDYYDNSFSNFNC